MEIKPVIESAAQQACEMKRHMWEHHGQRDMPPVVAFLIEGGEQVMQIPAAVIDEGMRATRDMPELVYGLFGAAPREVWKEDGEEFPGWRMILVISDGYTRLYPFDGPLPESPVALADDFRDNPSSVVSECLTVCVAASDLVGGCSIGVASIPYVVSDGGVIQFSEATTTLEEPGNPIEGGVPDALRRVFSEASS